MPQLEQVKHASSDNPSKELLEVLRGVCENLLGLAMGPLHPVFAYESAKGDTRSPGSEFLRQIMKKFGATAGPKVGETFYEGEDHKAPTKTEATLLKQVKKRTMAKATAQAVMDGLSSKQRFASRAEFVRCLAALVALFPKELRRKVAGTKSTVHKLLIRTAQPARAEWLFNHQRQRQLLSRAEASQAAMGTTSNEALHRELNRWFRTIVQMHQPTLRTKLTIFQLFKLLTHNSALYHATTIQIPQSLVASRVVSAANPFECDEQWRAWCAAQPEPQKKRKIVKIMLKTWKQKQGKGKKHSVMKTMMKRSRSVFQLYKGSGSSSSSSSLLRRVVPRKAMKG